MARTKIVTKRMLYGELRRCTVFSANGTGKEFVVFHQSMDPWPTKDGDEDKMDVDEKEDKMSTEKEEKLDQKK